MDSIELSQVVEAMLEEAEELFPGRYRVVNDNEFIHIVPAFSKNIQGISVARSSVLSTPISLSLTEANLIEALELVTEELSNILDMKIMHIRHPAVRVQKYAH